MAKSARSKVKRRLRNCRAEHLYQTVGKQKLIQMNGRLMDPTYDMKKEYAPAKNAFLEPNNPNAVFPQTAKPVIMDFRMHKMENGGLAAVNVFRKHLSANSTKSKWATVSLNAEEVAIRDGLAKAEAEAIEVDEKPTQVKSSKITVAELTEMTDKLKIAKKKKSSSDVEMKEAAPKISIKSKGIRKKIHCKKSQRLTRF